MLNLAFFVSILALFVLAGYIFRKGRQNISYLLFFWLVLDTWLWVFLNYLSITFIESSQLVYVVRFIMVAAIVQVTLFYLFASKFPDREWQVTDMKFIRLGVISMGVSIVSLTPLLFRGVLVENGIIHTQIGPGIIVFAVFVSFYITRAFKIILRKFHASAGMQRTQLLIILAAASINWLIIPITNFVFTLTFKNLVFVMASPLYGLIFSSLIAYALAKHHLFDAQRIMKDSTVYVGYYLKNIRNRTIEYYQLQSLVDQSSSNHVALDFSGVKNIDHNSVRFLHNLRICMEGQGKKIYFIGYTREVFKKLQQGSVL